MKYNTTYTPKISLKETIIKTNMVIKEIEKFYNSNYAVMDLIAPQFLEENSDMLLNLDSVTRSISFDITDGYKVGTMLLSHSNWIRDMADKLELGNDEVLKTFAPVVWRDLSENPVSTATKNILTYQVKKSDEVDVDKVMKNMTNNLYEVIFNLSKKINAEKEWEQQYPEIIPVVTAQMLENEYPTIDPESREDEISSEYDAFIFKNPGFKLFSGKLHTKIPAEVYSTKHYNQIVMKDFENSTVLKVASISLLASGKTLSDQLAMDGRAELRETPFYAKHIKNNYNIIEIKIDIGRLMMALLKKGHISEVQPGNISDEANTIQSKYKVEKY